LPLVFLAEGEPALQQASDWQATLMATDRVCWASAALSRRTPAVRGARRPGDDCYIAAYTYVTDTVTAGTHCTINHLRSCAAR